MDTATLKQGKAQRIIALAMVLVMAFAVASLPALVTSTPAAQASTSSQLKAKCTTALKNASGTTKAAKVKNACKTIEKKTAYCSLYKATKKYTHLDKISLAQTRTFGLYTFNNKQGSCYHFASVAAYLAKKAFGAGATVYVAVGKKGNEYHAWALVKRSGKSYIYDALNDKTKASCNGSYLGFTTGTAKYKNQYSGYYTTITKTKVYF